MRSPDDPEMPFLEHLEALRWHLVRGVAAIVLVAIVAFIAKELVFEGLVLAPMSTDFISYQFLCRFSAYMGLGEAFCITEIPFSIMNIAMAGQFTNHLIVSFAMGIIVGFPYFAWEMWRFLRPALSMNERGEATGMVFWVSLLFFIGVAFGFLVLTPVTVQFLGGYRVSEIVENQINLDSYVSTVAGVTFATALIFELPIVIFFMAKIGLVTAQGMREFRKYAVVVILMVAAVLTPPDITSQVLLFIPFYLLYEVSILIALRVERKQARRERARE